MSLQLRNIAIGCLLGGSMMAIADNAFAWTLECRTFNQNDRPTQVFIPGEKLKLRLNLDIPGQTLEQKASFKIKGYLRKGGLNIPYALNNFDASLPVDKKGISFQTEKRLEIPRSFAGSELFLQIRAKVAEAGTAECTRKIIVN
jgi:hypothetical protein